VIKNLTGEGDPAPQFPIYRCDLNDKPLERVAEFDTVEEVLTFTGRGDWRCVVFVRRKPMTLIEFRQWAKTRSRTTTKTMS
jgi:hypothetical protein